MKKNFKRLAAVLLSIMMFAATGVTAFAGANSIQNDGTATIKKTFTSNSPSAAKPDETVTFAVAKKSYDGETTNEFLALMPEISNKSIAFDGSDTWAYSSSGSGSLYEGKYYISKETNAIDGVTWLHAGIYEYEVSEIANITSGITYDDTKYIMTVYVKEDPSNGFVVGHVEFHKVENDAKGAKTNPEFVNKNEATETFSLKKTVTGDYASKNKKFEFNLELHAANNDGDEAFSGTYVGYIKRANGDLEKVEVTVGTPAIINLAHNDELFFDGSTQTIAGTSTEIDNLPVGITYTLSEAGTADYTPSAIVTIGGGMHNGAGTQGSVLQIGGSDTATITDPALQAPIEIKPGVNNVKWNNAYSLPTPTGIIMNNLPFILMILVAVGGFAGYIVLKRRKA